MEIELVPDAGCDDAVARAARAALTASGIDLELHPDASGSAWRRAGLAEAMARGSERDGQWPQALTGSSAPVRSSRGATRA